MSVCNTRQGDRRPPRSRCRCFCGLQFVEQAYLRPIVATGPFHFPFPSQSPLASKSSINPLHAGTINSLPSSVVKRFARARMASSVLVSAARSPLILRPHAAALRMVVRRLVVVEKCGERAARQRTMSITVHISRSSREIDNILSLTGVGLQQRL